MLPNKRCNICLMLFPLDNFYKRSGRINQIKAYCKECDRAKTRQYMTTKKGLLSVMYSHQKKSSKKRGMQKPSYSKEEFKEWLFSQSDFHKMYDNWKRLDYQKEYIPSVDRKDDLVSYTIANIQLMTWKENREKYFNRNKGA